MTLPAAAALWVMSEPIVRLVYERGAFAANHSTPIVASILAIFGLGLPAFVLIKAFTPGYFAREDTRTPMIFAAISVGVNVATALTLFPSMGAPGIAVASAVAGWVNALMLLAMLIRRGHWGRDIPLLRRIPRLVLSAVIMAVALYFAERHFATQIGPGSPLVVKATTVLALVAGGAALYFIAAFGTGGADFGMIRRNVKRGSKAPPITGQSPDP
jgi:putative peptidoglycan lipid II flippase